MTSCRHAHPVTGQQPLTFTIFLPESKQHHNNLGKLQEFYHLLMDFNSKVNESENALRGSCEQEIKTNLCKYGLSKLVQRVFKPMLD